MKNLAHRIEYVENEIMKESNFIQRIWRGSYSLIAVQTSFASTVECQRKALVLSYLGPSNGASMRAILPEHEDVVKQKGSELIICKWGRISRSTSLESIAALSFESISFFLFLKLFILISKNSLCNVMLISVLFNIVYFCYVYKMT